MTALLVIGVALAPVGWAAAFREARAADTEPLREQLAVAEFLILDLADHAEGRAGRC